MPTPGVGERMCKGNDDTETETGNAQTDCAGKRAETARVEAEERGTGGMTISKDVFEKWKDSPILHDEDEWDGEYSTYGEMWEGEGYTIEE